VFPIGGPATASWREHALARAAEYRFLARYFLSEATDPQSVQALAAIERHLDIAERAAEGGRRSGKRSRGERALGPWGRLVSLMGGASVERANSHLDAVETDLLRLAPGEYLLGSLPSLVAHVRAHLAPHDPRAEGLERLAQTVAKDKPDRLAERDRTQVLTAVRAASLEARYEIRRVRSFRNILVVSALVLTLGVAGVTLLGVLKEDVIPVCFAPDDVMIVCPTATAAVEDGQMAPSAGGEVQPATVPGPEVDAQMRETAGPWDIPVVQIAGFLAAALAGAFAVRTIQGTSTPYSLPVAVALLKLPAGALTAVLGLLLMRGGFVPGLSALDSSAQIIAWAVVFGYSQQLLTQFVDRQAKTVLDNVGEPANAQLTAPGGQPRKAAATPA
jgi:hypothetical protein